MEASQSYSYVIVSAVAALNGRLFLYVTVTYLIQT